LSAEPAATGRYSWNPAAGGTVDVRLRVRDLAKNEGESTLRLTPGGQGARPSSNFAEPDTAAAPGRTAIGKRWVNNKRISLNYEVKEAGPSGLQAVELWMTRDGHNWIKHSEDATHTPPLIFEVPEEGVYGFTLLVRSGVGLSERQPRSGDAPQIWVEVDLTPPIVHTAKAEVGRGSDTGVLTITWKATDKNLAREPISLFYCEKPEGTWTPIERNIENSGKYRWQMPPGVPYKFYVRVEATDLAGNAGSYDTPQPAIVDLAQPKGLILSVDPASKDAAANRNQGPVSKER
jgi:hypothetical protein